MTFRLNLSLGIPQQLPLDASKLYSLDPWQESILPLMEHLHAPPMSLMEVQ